MAIKNEQTELTEVHHALLFALLVKAVIERVGEQRGQAVIQKAVRQYGAERGRRMALRAKANGHALSMGNYLAYVEFKVKSKGMLQKIVEKVPHARVCVTGCPWHHTWETNGLMPYGRLYCLDVDEAVVQGFNPDLKLDVVGTQSNGAAQCEFLFRDANLTLKNYLAFALKKLIRPGKKAVMPWDYHVGHLFSTLEKVIFDDLGETGKLAVQSALAQFAEKCGETAVQAIQAGRKLDYTSV